MTESPSARRQCRAPVLNRKIYSCTLTRTALFYILLTLVLVVAQVVVFNHICLFGVAVPFVFIYLLIALPLTLSQAKVLTIAFFLGLTVDIFSDTAGLYALGCTVTGALRHPVMRLYFPREEDLTDPRPSVDSLGLAVFIRYALTLTLVFSTVVILADSFAFFRPLRILLLILGSTLITTALIVALDFITIHRREKRL